METVKNNGFVSRGPVVLGVTAAMLVTSTVFVAFRMISRFWVVRKPGWDDYTMILAWVSKNESMEMAIGQRLTGR